MAPRVIYPTPVCPRCGHKVSWVKNTYYTTDGRIVRNRMCDDCEWRWNTLQYPEHSIDPGKYAIRIPRWGTYKQSRKQIEIVPIGELS